MSCEVTNSPFPDPGFASPFDVDDTHGEKVNFTTRQDFNFDFDAVNHGCVDPQSLSNAGSPSGHFGPAPTPDFAPDMYPPDLHAIPAPPYFQSVEQPFGNHIGPSHLRTQHLHRRSVSEPPDGALMHHHVPHPDAPLTFHRDGQTLGASRLGAPPIKRVKQSRTQPYKRSHHQPPPHQSRYQLRRNHAQTTHLPPTSVPHGLPVDRSHQPQQMHHMPFEHMQREPQYVSSRVCTPAPEAIDPFLDASPVPMIAPMVANRSFEGHAGSGNDASTFKGVTIKMDVDEFRAMITEVVQKAVGGLQAGKSIATADSVVEEDVAEQSMERVQADNSAENMNSLTDIDIDDEIVVATGFVGKVGDALIDTDAKPTMNE